MGGVITEDGQVNPTGHLIVGGVKLEGPAWAILDDLTPIVSPGAWRGGDSVVIPHQPGRLAMPIIVDEQTFKFRFPIAGDVDETDTYFEVSPAAGYMANVTTLRAALDVPDLLTSPDSTIPVEYHCIDGVTYVADCQFNLDLTAQLKIGTTMKFGRPGAMKRAVLTMRCPHGLFVVEGS